MVSLERYDEVLPTKNSICLTLPMVTVAFAERLTGFKLVKICPSVGFVQLTIKLLQLAKQLLKVVVTPVLMTFVAAGSHCKVPSQMLGLII